MRASLALAAMLLLLASCRARDDAAAGSEPPKPAAKSEQAATATGWNDGAIAWRSWADGKAEAAKTGKPICLVFFTTWCPHCTNYSRVFHDPRVVAAAKDFVMIRVDRDLDEELSARYAPDGQYIPRTYSCGAPASSPRSTAPATASTSGSSTSTIPRRSSRS